MKDLGRQSDPSSSENLKLVVSELIKDILGKAAEGFNKYGSVSETHNGRNSLKDAYQELVDLLLYLKQRLMEDDLKEKTLIDLADAQFIGFSYRDHSNDIIGLVESMGLTKDEWEEWKKNYDVGLSEDRKNEIDEYFKEV